MSGINLGKEYQNRAKFGKTGASSIKTGIDLDPYKDVKIQNAKVLSMGIKKLPTLEFEENLSFGSDQGYYKSEKKIMINVRESICSKKIVI